MLMRLREPAGNLLPASGGTSAGHSLPRTVKTLRKNPSRTSLVMDFRHCHSIRMCKSLATSTYDVYYMCICDVTLTSDCHRFLNETDYENNSVGTGLPGLMN